MTMSTSNSERVTRCFPHVINLAVQEGLKFLTRLESDSEGLLNEGFGIEDISQFSEQLLEDQDYFLALRGDVVAEIRSFVNTVRSSGQRREQFDSILRAGNASGGWGSESKLLRPVGLKRDIVTRWSSTYNMVDNFVELYLVCEFSSHQFELLLMISIKGLCQNDQRKQ